jgi:hypothetical protein
VHQMVGSVGLLSCVINGLCEFLGKVCSVACLMRSKDGGYVQVG